MEANDVWYSEYELRQFIDMAVRWDIEAIFKNRTSENPFSVFDYYVKTARANFELFSKQLNRKLTGSQNWKAIEIDVKDRFLPMVENYLSWYKEHQAQTEKFEPYNPYALMLSVIESTKREILKYFPEPKEKSYNSFDKLFEDAAHFGTLGDLTDPQAYLRAMSLYQLEFNLWLGETKGWVLGDGALYRQLLTKDNWKEFLLYKKQQEAERQMRFDAEKKTWQTVQHKDVSNLKEEQWEPLIERNALLDFLSVPAPDVLHGNAFWHDENDLPIDCNIYHPRYGYPGFEAPANDVIVTSFQPVTVYKNAKDDQYIYCRYYWPMLCTADEINFTNKDGVRVIKDDYLQTHQTRLAGGEQDFEIIYQREFGRRKLPDEPQVSAVFCNELAEHVQKLKVLHKERSRFDKDRDINVLALAEKFIEYLNGKIKGGFMPNTKPQCLKDIFPDQEAKVSVIMEAIRDLNITGLLSERQLTGFIDGCKKADALPQIENTVLLRVIYNEIGKPYTNNSKPRYDKSPYADTYNKTIRYFGLK